MHIFNQDTLIHYLNLTRNERDKIKEIQLSQLHLWCGEVQRLIPLMDMLPTCTQLESLILENNEIGTWDNLRLKMLGKSLLHCTALKKIHLEDNKLNKLAAFGFQTLFGFLSLSSVQTLYLQRNDLGKLNLSCLIELGKACAQFKHLRCLHLGYNSFHESDIASFKTFFNTLALSRVQELDLEGNDLGKLASPFLTEFKEMLVKFKNLRIISVAQNKLKQSEDSYFEAFQCSKTLCEIEGIQEFTDYHRKTLNWVLLCNKRQLQPPQPLLEKKLQPLPSKVKKLAFSDAYPQLKLRTPSPPATIPVATGNAPNFKKLKIGKDKIINAFKLFLK